MPEMSPGLSTRKHDWPLVGGVISVVHDFLLIFNRKNVGKSRTHNQCNVTCQSVQRRNGEMFDVMTCFTNVLTS